MKSRGAQALSSSETRTRLTFSDELPLNSQPASATSPSHRIGILGKGRPAGLNGFTQIGQINKDCRVGTKIQVSGALGQHCLHFSHPQTEDSEGAPSLTAQQRILFKLTEGCKLREEKQVLKEVGQSLGPLWDKQDIHRT